MDWKLTHRQSELVLLKRSLPEMQARVVAVGCCGMIFWRSLLMFPDVSAEQKPEHFGECMQAQHRHCMPGGDGGESGADQCRQGCILPSLGQLQD